MRFLVLSIIIVPHIYCIIWADERWPYSHYPMYARIQSETCSFQAITGVSEDGVEVDLTETRFWGVSWGMMRGGIRSYMRRHKTSTAGSDSLAVAILNQYERRRSLGLHRGPRVVRVRIETKEWNLDSRAAVESPPLISVHADSDGGFDENGVSK